MQYVYKLLISQLPLLNIIHDVIKLLYFVLSFLMYYNKINQTNYLIKTVSCGAYSKREVYKNYIFRARKFFRPLKGYKCFPFNVFERAQVQVQILADANLSSVTQQPSASSNRRQLLTLIQHQMGTVKFLWNDE